jgi:hypothetical protein
LLVGNLTKYTRQCKTAAVLLQRLGGVNPAGCGVAIGRFPDGSATHLLDQHGFTATQAVNV